MEVIVAGDRYQFFFSAAKAQQYALAEWIQRGWLGVLYANPVIYRVKNAKLAVPAPTKRQTFFIAAARNLGTGVPKAASFYGWQPVAEYEGQWATPTWQVPEWTEHVVELVPSTDWQPASVAQLTLALKGVSPNAIMLAKAAGGYKSASGWYVSTQHFVLGSHQGSARRDHALMELNNLPLTDQVVYWFGYEG